MVMDDEELTDLRGAIPQYQFQVERCEGYFLTSRPYPLNDITAIDIDFEFGVRVQPQNIEAIANQFDFISGDLNQILLSYPDGDPEAIEVTGFEFISGFTNETIFGEYDSGEPEAVDTSFDFISGDLNVALVIYDEALPEAVQVTDFDLISGTLT